MRKDNNNWLLLKFPSSHCRRKRNCSKFKTVESNIIKSYRYRASINFLSLRNCLHWHKVTTSTIQIVVEMLDLSLFSVFWFIADVFSFVHWIPLLNAIRDSVFLYLWKKREEFSNKHKIFKLNIYKSAITHNIE